VVRMELRGSSDNRTLAMGTRAVDGNAAGGWRKHRAVRVIHVKPGWVGASARGQQTSFKSLLIFDEQRRHVSELFAFSFYTSGGQGRTKLTAASPINA